MAEKHAARREYDGGKDQEGLEQAVELCDQDDAHDCDCNQHRLGQERLRFVLIIITAAKFDVHRRIDLYVGQQLAHLTDDVVV